jgi:alpha-glucosidase (family GH31 glycosyl hydrolase)
MKSGKIFVLISLIVLVFTGCKNKLPQANVSMAIKGKNQYPEYTINSTDLETPVTITSNGNETTGSIYFKTAEKIVWLQGNPVVSKRESGGLHNEWELGDRRIIIDIIRNGGDFIFDISAQPDDDIIGWGVNLDGANDEFFTGLFERTAIGKQKKTWEEGIDPGMNMHGLEVEMIIEPTLSLNAPFYISSRGYGMFVHGTWPGKYDFCKEISDLVQVSSEGKNMNFKIYTSDQPADIVKSHAKDAGGVFLPPKWAFTPHKSIDKHANMDKSFDSAQVKAPYNSMVVEDVLMMEALDIPCGLYWIDRPWSKGGIGYGGFDWDEERFPDHEEMIKWLNDKGMELMLWIAPWVGGDMAETALEKGYNMNLEQKDGYQWLSKNQLAIVDFTNPDACSWWQKGLVKMLKQGVKGYKLERTEEIVPESRTCKVHDGRTCREVKNHYPVMFIREAYEACKRIHGDDFVCMTRAAYTGSAQYGVFSGGDYSSSQEGLRAAIIALQKSSILGYPIWGAYIGGFEQGKMEREVAARWLAFGAFCPIMEVGATEGRSFWDTKNNDPSYDAELIAIWRLYAKLHTNLIDYSYQYAQEAGKTGMPVARPLFLAYPNQKEAWEDWQTYMFGEEILVSCIWKKDKRSHVCYLPEGTKWQDAWNKDKVYEGGQKVSIKTPMHKIPIFIKQGSDVDLGDLTALYQESLKIAKTKPNMKTLENKEFGDK